jgi:demethylmenaquinone methyltransferase/2-methoxy-6-polyprenyl-1,4-benzoquinol methylase
VKDESTMTETDPQQQPAWKDDDLVNPHAKADKAQRVQRMFSAIAASYDLNNRLHSMWQDQAWRRKAVRLCQVKSTDTVMDVACGTGDLSLAFADAGARRVLGIDFTHNMVAIATQKSQQAPTPMLYADGDAMRLPVADKSVDVVSIAFGIRNVADPALAIREFFRTLRSGGRLCILEFSLPTNPIMRGLYNFYFRRIMPHTATLISRDRSGAYKYLPESVNTFLGREQMVKMITQAGFVSVQQFPMTFGIAVAYTARKR